MRFLLVEADASLAKSLARGRREQADAVDVAADGDDALEQQLPALRLARDRSATC